MPLRTQARHKCSAWTAVRRTSSEGSVGACTPFWGLHWPDSFYQCGHCGVSSTWPTGGSRGKATSSFYSRIWSLLKRLEQKKHASYG